MRATEFLTEYAGMDEPYPDLRPESDNIQNSAVFHASIPDTNKTLYIHFWNLVNVTDGLTSFKVIDISFGIRQPDRHITNYDPPTGLGGTPQAQTNARQMFRILSTVVEALNRYIAEYGEPTAFSFSPLTHKLGQIYSRLESRMLTKYKYIPVSLIKLGDIASSLTGEDYHEVFSFFDTRTQYFVKSDLVRQYD